MKFNRFTVLNCMRRILPAFAVAAALFQGTATAEQVIGLLAPLSGKNAVLGKQLELGARLAADKLQATGNGEKIIFEIRDSKCDADEAKSAAEQLLRVQAKIVIGPLCSEALFAALEVLSPAGIPVIVPFLSASRLDFERKNNDRLVYTLAGNVNAEADAISRILLKRWQGKAYAIADDGGIYGRGIADRFKTLADLSGQRPVAQANFRPLQSTQIAMLRRLAKNNIEALFVGGDASDVAQIARDARKINLDIEVAGGESLTLLPFVDDAPSIPEGILSIMQRPPADFASAKNFVVNLKQQGLSADGAVIPGYALYQIAALAISNNNLMLEGQEYSTIMGQVSFDQNGRADALSYSLHVWKDQKMMPLGGS